MRITHCIYTTEIYGKRWNCITGNVKCEAWQTVARNIIYKSVHSNISSVMRNRNTLTYTWTYNKEKGALLWIAIHYGDKIDSYQTMRDSGGNTMIEYDEWQKCFK